VLGTSKFNTEGKEANQYKRNLRKAMQDVHHLARENIKAAQLRQKKDYDLTVNKRKYKLGDLVHRLNPTTKIGQSKKLKSLWLGPYVVAQVLSSVLCMIRYRKKATVIHHDQLKSCDDSDVPKWVERMQECIISGSDVDPFVCTQFMDSSGLFEPSHPSEDIAGFHGSTMEDGDAPIVDKKNRQPVWTVTCHSCEWCVLAVVSHFV
jgi:Sec-independent protein translocase protein TatA